MIMPVSAAPSSAKPVFRGAIKDSAVLDDITRSFTKMESMRWENVTSEMRKANDNLLFNVSTAIEEIGKTVIKRLVISQEGKGSLAEEVFRVTKGGSVFMYDRESVKRTVLETFEKIYIKGEKI